MSNTFHKNRSAERGPVRRPLRRNTRHSLENSMDQRYIETVRSAKAILRNLDYLDESATYGQRTELCRLLAKVRDRLEEFLKADEQDEGLFIGEE
ncbi:MAG: hypothetical protein OEZ59_00350 [Deltaproteobacteria bacterium]|nr:hypothetical protein [Deltaproteobacteria bacterium]